MRLTCSRRNQTAHLPVQVFNSSLNRDQARKRNSRLLVVRRTTPRCLLRRMRCVGAIHGGMGVRVCVRWREARSLLTRIHRLLLVHILCRWFRLGEVGTLALVATADTSWLLLLRLLVRLLLSVSGLSLTVRFIA